MSAWVVDDTGIAKDGSHSPGVKRQYSGTLGKIGNCQVRCRCTRSASAARSRWGGRCICPRSGARIGRGGARPRSPTRSSFRPSRSSRRAVRAGGRVGDPARAGAGRLRLRRQLRLPHRLARARARVRARRSVPRSACSGPRRLQRCPSAAPGDGGRRASRARPRARSGRALAERLPAEAWQTCPAAPPRPARSSQAGSRSCASSPRTRSRTRPPAAALGVADHRMARRPRRADRLLALQPARGHRARAARAAGAAALDDRARLPPTQGRDSAWITAGGRS